MPVAVQPINSALHHHLTPGSAHAAFLGRRHDMIVPLAVRLLEMIAPEDIDVSSLEEIDFKSWSEESKPQH